MVCQLTGLRRLLVGVLESSNDWVKGLLLQLTRLQQLTYLELGDPEICSGDPTQGGFFLKVEVSGDVMGLRHTMISIGAGFLLCTVRSGAQGTCSACDLRHAN